MKVSPNRKQEMTALEANGIQLYFGTQTTFDGVEK
jgi:hypothetical protein